MPFNPFKKHFSYHFSTILLFLFNFTLTFSHDTLFLKKGQPITLGYSNVRGIDTSNSNNIENIKFNIPDSIKENKNQNYWKKYILNNKTKYHFFSIEFEDPHIGNLEMYSKNSKNEFLKILTSGFSTPFNFRAISHKNHICLININTNETVTLYIKYSNQVVAGLNTRIKPVTSFIDYALKEYIILGIFYGILLLLLIYNFLLYFTNKKKYYLWYVGYIICCCIQTLNENGIGFQYLWPNLPYLNYLFYDFGGLLLAISFLAYAKSFLGEKYINLKQFGLLTLLLIVAHFIFTIPFLNKYWTFPYMIFYIYIFYISIKGFKNIKNNFSYFNIGNLFLLTSFLILFARNLNILPSFWLTVYFFNFGFVFEGIIFSYAMAHRLNKTHKKMEESQLIAISELKEKELLKDKVNRELEEKVSERTHIIENQKLELVKLNDELTEFHKKINYINSELDKDNYKLKKSLVEEKKQKVLKRIVSFEEFGSVFKKESDCVKHLVELKWSEGFKCKKCKNKNFANVPKSHNRKCTSCKHIESPTANTIFHGIKFPLDKAFYIVYLTHYSKKEFTLDELSTELDLRRNTLWSFKKKVIERKESLLKANKIVVNSPWERLIID